MNALSTIWRDLRYAVRSFNKDRGSIAMALLALALGIGATTVIFSVVDNVLINPFPYKDAHHLVHMYVHDVTQSGPFGQFGFPVSDFIDYRDQNHAFTNLVGALNFDVLYSTGTSTEQFDGAIVTSDSFDPLGVKPILGRAITPSDGSASSPPVFCMGENLWRRRFNADPNLIGKSFVLNNQPRTLLCIMPKRFRLLGGDIIIPFVATRDLTNAFVGGPAAQPLFLWTMEHLKPGVSMEQAAADFDVMVRREAPLHPQFYPKQFRILTSTIAERYTQGLRKMIFILLGAVLLLLLIACSNVANLLLARATAREKELAIRATLGATRGRLIRQLLAESFVLAVAGGIAGCALAYAGLTWVAKTIPPGTVPTEVEIHLSLPALLLTIAITFVTTLICGLVPALYAARRDLYTRLMSTGKGVSGSTGHGRLRNALVAAQVGLAIVLLVGAGLMMRTFFALEHTDIGFNPNNLLVARVPFPQGRYTTGAQKQVFFREILQRIGTLPGVTAASESITPPLVNSIRTSVVVPGKTHSETWYSLIELVSEGYFQTVGIPLVRGNLLSQSDVDSGRHVIVINQKLAHDFFGDEDPIGRSIQFDVLNRVPDAPHDAAFEIVGIVGDIKNQNIEQPVMPEAFMSYAITGISSRTILVRTAVTPLSLLKGVRDAVSAVDPGIPLTNTADFSVRLHEAYMAAPEFGLVLLSVFAAIGLILSAIGVFSVMAYSVSLQTHDIGIRMALGAQPPGVLNMVLLKGLRPIAAGVVIGLLASYGLTRLMASQIYGVAATDPLTFGAVVIVLTLVGIAACLFPARRAMRVDPLVALRYE